MKILKDNKEKDKLIILFILFLLLQIPLFMVKTTLKEREILKKIVTSEIGETWGESQIIKGPMVIIPYIESYSEIENGIENGLKYEREITKKRKNHVVMWPDELSINSTVENEIKKRGIYNVPVYSSEINLKGSFSQLESKLPRDYDEILYDDAIIFVGISDTKGILKAQIQQGDKNLFIESEEIAQLNGISGRFQFISGFDFSVDLKLRGNSQLNFAPLGQQNEIVISSSWPNPSFKNFLPSNTKIEENGFTASWSISNLTRSNKQQFLITSSSPLEFPSTGLATVELHSGISNYVKVYRAIKYSILFVVVSFLATYFIDMSSVKKTHCIQYGVLGVSLILFYLLLLSLSEHFSFLGAYFVSTVLILIPICLYMIQVTKNIKSGVAIFGLLLSLYTVIYFILNMEDYALLMGTILLLFIMYIIMFITKNIETNVLNEKSHNKNLEE